MRKTKLEIINETAEFYGTDPKRRATSAFGGCEYLTSDGRMCAFGRCERSPVTRNPESFCPRSKSVGIRFEDVRDMDDVLKEEYRGHDIQFWSAVQGFHDTSSNWDDSGLSNAGQTHLKKLQERYGG